MRHSAKAVWNQEFDSDEECFLDAFLHGEFHEEEPDFVSLTEALSKRQLISLFLPVCRVLIASSVNCREGSKSLKTLMDCFSALGKWSKAQLRSPEEILKPLGETRVVVFREVVEHRGEGWWAHIFSYFEMLEAGIYRRMGVHQIAINDEYRAVERKLKAL